MPNLRIGSNAYLLQFSRESAQYAFISEENSLIRKLGGCHPFFINIAAYHLFANKTTEHIKPLDTVTFEIQNDQAVLSTYKYYWNKLTDRQRKLLMGVISGDIGYPYTREVETELHWLYKLSLLEKAETGTYFPFSESFSEFVLQRVNSKPSVISPTPSLDSIFDILSLDESPNLEFKSSLRWDVQQNRKNDELEIAVIKTIAAFLNTHGGTLIIGVDDQQNILGLENDYKSLAKKPNKDGFELHLFQLVKSRIGAELCELISVIFHVIEDKEICQVVVQASAIPVFVDKDKLYFRTGNSTDYARTSQDAIRYYVSHWKNGTENL